MSADCETYILEYGRQGGRFGLFHTCEIGYIYENDEYGPSPDAVAMCLVMDDGSSRLQNVREIESPGELVGK